jgi:DNA-binding FrmR family transcriptional regulator
VAGQVQGIERMVAHRRPCDEILVQLAAAEAALRAASLQVHGQHVRAIAHRLTNSDEAAAGAAEILRTANLLIRL